MRGRRRIIWTEQHNQRLRQQRLSGVPVKQIAAGFGVSEGYIDKRLKLLGLSVPRISRATRKDQLAELLAEGRTVADAAAAIGITANFGAILLGEIRRELGWQAQ